MFAALDLALIGALEGGADGDDPAWTRHLQLQIGIVGDSHELRVAWMSEDGMVGSMEPNHLEGEGLYPIIGRILEGDGQIDLPITFRDPSNYRTETLTFKVVRIPGTFHAILGRPCYAKFMAVPNYTYLKLKMP